MANAPTDDRRLFSPSTARNREPIHAVLEASLASSTRHASTRVLELASGSGEHAVYMAERHPDWQWQPSDVDDDAIQSIEAWRRHSGLNNILAPQRRDLLEDWVGERLVDNSDSDEPWDAMVAINLVHISPWTITERLMLAAQRHLVSGGVLFLYGPYRRGGEHTAPSNAQFDVWLKARDSRWGVRDLEQVVAEATANGLTLQGVEQLPANNLAVVFQRD